MEKVRVWRIKKVNLRYYGLGGKICFGVKNQDMSIGLVVQEDYKVLRFKFYLKVYGFYLFFCKYYRVDRLGRRYMGFFVSVFWKIQGIVSFLRVNI